MIYDFWRIILGVCQRGYRNLQTKTDLPPIGYPFFLFLGFSISRVFWFWIPWYGTGFRIFCKPLEVGLGPKRDALLSHANCIKG